MAEQRTLNPQVRGSSPRRPTRHLADVAELVDALDLGSSELCSWRFESSHPHNFYETSTTISVEVAVAYNFPSESVNVPLTKITFLPSFSIFPFAYISPTSRDIPLK